MKKIFTLVAAAMVSAVSFAQSYSWSSPSGTVTEVGGTAESVTSKAERLNFPVVVSESLTYYTISLSGKVGNINAGAVDNDKDAASHVKITMNNAFASGDKIILTGFVNKDQAKNGSAAVVFSDDAKTEVDSENFPNIGLGEQIASQEIEVPAAAVGTNVFKLTRKNTQTNVYLTKVEVVSATGVSKAIEVSEDSATYNLQGVKVGADYKGVVVKNGKKFIK